VLAIWKSFLVLWWNLWAQGQGLPAEQLLAGSCVGCHPSEVADWQQSRHSVAFTNGLFRAEYDLRRTAWCASCHAPSAPDPRTVSDDDVLAIQGIGCMTCHMGSEGRLLARSKSSDSPHKTLVSEEFGSTEFCAGCHEFRFPVMGEDGMPTGFLDLPMQETVSEFRTTRAAEQGDDCRSCHMVPSVGAHRFVGSHDEPTLRSALAWDVCVQGDELWVEIANIGAAHAVPTGGVNRHMVLRLWQSDAPEAMVEHFIGRRFEGDEGGEKKLVLSTSLAAGERRIFRASLTNLKAKAKAPVNIELRYIYPLDEFAKLTPETRRFATVFRQRSIASEFDACPQP
jgi:hypothetical protein